MGGREAEIPLLHVGEEADLTDLLPAGTPGQLLSGGSILVYNLLIAAKVFVGGWAVIAVFAQHRGEL